MSRQPRYRQLTDLELSPEQDEKIGRMTEEADRDIEQARVNLRWGKAQVATVKRAAGVLGVPYQTYIKQVVFRQAVADIREAEQITKTD